MASITCKFCGCDRNNLCSYVREGDVFCDVTCADHYYAALLDVTEDAEYDEAMADDDMDEPNPDGVDDYDYNDRCPDFADFDPVGEPEETPCVNQEEYIGNYDPMWDETMYPESDYQHEDSPEFFGAE